MLREFQEEIKRLKSQLENQGGEGDVIVREVEEVHEIEEIEEIEQEVVGSDVGEDEADPSADGPSDAGSKKKKSVLKKPKARRGSQADSAASQARLQDLQTQLEKEKAVILQKKDLEESEKKRLIQEAEQRLQELDEEKRKKEEVAAKLAQLEQKLLVGGVNLLDKDQEQQMMLAKKAQELEERARKERELQRELEEHEETGLQIEEEFTSLQEEATAKTKKIKKLWNVLMSHKTEIKDLQEEHQREREDLLDTIRELTKELKYRLLLLDSFIAPEEQGLIEEFSEFDEGAEKWRIAFVAHAGNNIRGKRSLVSGKILKKDRRQSKSKIQSEASGWDPMCAFPNVYLQYDLHNVKSPTKKKPTLKISSKKSVGRKSSQSTKDISPRDLLVDGSPSPITDAPIPQARGLVGRSKHYA